MNLQQNHSWVLVWRLLRLLTEKYINSLNVRSCCLISVRHKPCYTVIIIVTELVRARRKTACGQSGDEPTIKPFVGVGLCEAKTLLLIIFNRTRIEESKEKAGLPA